MANKIAIIGGGIMGLAMAYQLAQKNYVVTIYEAAPKVGGLTASWKIGNHEWDKFYHVILMSDTRTVQLIKELGLESKLVWKETKTGFYSNKRLYSMSNIIEYIMFPPLNLIEKFRLALTIVAASKIKNWKRLEKIPVTTWLIRWSGKQTFNKIWLPLLRAKLGDSYKKASAAFIWATIQRLYGARRSGLKKEMFGYVQGGYAEIINAFSLKLQNLGVEIKTGSELISIQSNGNNHPVISFNNGTKTEFPKVIITIPSGIAADKCLGLSINEIFKLKNIEYLGVVCVSLLLDQSISPFYVTNITDSSVPFTGVIEMTALVDKSNFGGNALIYLPKYVISTDEIFNEPEDLVKAYFIESFIKMYPHISPSNIKFSGIARARHVIALPALSYSESLPPVKMSLPGVYIVNSAHITKSTLNVNETLEIAQTKISEILEDEKWSF